MALQVTALAREIKFERDGKTIELVDPNPEFTVDEVIKFYSGTYPDLTNSLVEGPTIVKDKAVYKLKTKAGQLG